MIKARWNRIALFSAAVVLPAGTVLAQVASPVQPAPRAPVPAAKPATAPATADPIGPLPEGAEATEPAPLPPPPPPIWQVPQAHALLNYIYNVGREGPDPADYDADGERRY